MVGVQRVENLSIRKADELNAPKPPDSFALVKDPLDATVELARASESAFFAPSRASGRQDCEGKNGKGKMLREKRSKTRGNWVVGAQGQPEVGVQQPNSRAASLAK